MNRPMNIRRIGILSLGVLGGPPRSVTVVIVDANPREYRVRLPERSNEAVPIPGSRRRLIGAVSVWIPRAAVRPLGLGAVLSDGVFS